MSFLNNDNLQTADSEVFEIIENELKRQTNHLEMIASENFTSPAVMEAMGSVFTNNMQKVTHTKGIMVDVNMQTK